MKTQIFAYDGIVGIKAGSAFVNDPTQPGQLGCIVKVDEVEITEDAYNILCSLDRSNDVLGDVSCWAANDKLNYFSWMGISNRFLTPGCVGDRDFNPSLLKDKITSIEVPDDFIVMVLKYKSENHPCE